MHMKVAPALANARPSAPHTPTPTNPESRDVGSQQRRAILFSLLPVVLPTVLPVPVAMLGPQQASAFDNRLPADEIMKKYPTPKTPGPQPQDLGLRADGSLKACIDSKPHCFSSSLTGSGLENLDEDEDLVKEEWMVDPFLFTGGKSDADAYSQLEQVVLAYPPGQAGIDGGGWKIVKESEKDGVKYMYVQYESLRRGYIDDVEFALAKGIVNVRTSSRVGYLDLGVNAKRYNWFARRLQSTGKWRTRTIQQAEHPEYFAQNQLSSDA